MNKLITLAWKLRGGTIVRHIIAFIGTFFAAQDLSNGQTLNGLLTGFTFLLGVTVWSKLMGQAKPDATLLEKLHEWSAAAARHALPAIAGWLQAKGYQGDLTPDAIGTEPVLVFLGGYLVSLLNKPKSPLAPKTLTSASTAATRLLILTAITTATLTLSSCRSTAQVTGYPKHAPLLYRIWFLPC